jgi:hypothetical protein
MNREDLDIIGAARVYSIWLGHKERYLIDCKEEVPPLNIASKLSHYLGINTLKSNSLTPIGRYSCIKAYSQNKEFFVVFNPKNTKEFAIIGRELRSALEEMDKNESTLTLVDISDSRSRNDIKA